MVGLSSGCRRIVFILAEAIQGFLAEILNSEWQAQYLVSLKGDFIPAPRSVNDAAQITRMNHEIQFAWQARLVKLECDFSWQAQHFVQFWEIAGARHVVFCHSKCVSKMGRVRSPKRRVRDDDFILGLSSVVGICVRIVFLLAEAIQGFLAQILTQNLLDW